MAYVVHNKSFLLWQLLVSAVYIFVAGYAYDALLSSQGTNTLFFWDTEVTFVAFVVTTGLMFTIIEASKLAGDMVQQDKDNGMFKQMLFLPFSRFELLVAFISLSVIMSLIGSFVILGITFPTILSGQIVVHEVRFELIVFGVLAGSVFLSSLAVIIALLSKTHHRYDTANNAIFLVFLPILSTVYYPVSAELPQILQAVFYANPITHVIDIVRAGIFGSSSQEETTTTLIIMTPQMIIVSVVAVATFLTAVVLMENDRKKYE